MMTQFLLIVALLFALAVAVFAVQNAEHIVVQLFSTQLETSLVVVVLASAAAGAVMAGIVGVVRQVKASVKVRQLKGKIARLERRLAALAPEDEGGESPGADETPPENPGY